MKGGYWAYIYATRKSTGVRASIRVTVKRNKVDYINTRPAATMATYKKGGISLKSVEIVSPSKVVAEYYVAFNFPSSWKALSIMLAVLCWWI